MKKTNLLFVIVISFAMIFSSCDTLNQTSKGTMIGGGSGAAIGAGIGGLFGKDGKSAGIGAAVGGAVGATIGAIIGKKMDKAAEDAAQVEGAQVETVEDANGLKAVKVTFDSGILFAFNSTQLNATSKESLKKFSKILVDNPTMDISIYGHTDNVGKLNVNKRISRERAQSVADYLIAEGATRSQMKTVEGLDYSNPVASNETAEGRALNRRVEVYMYASEKMIQEAEAESAN